MTDSRISRAKPYLIALIAVIGYGGWAYYSNAMVDTTIAIRAACIQGGYSGLLTLFNVLILEALFRKLDPHLPCNANMALTLLIATTLQYAIIIPVHWLNQTPNILTTLLPGFVIGTLFSAAYLLSLKRTLFPKTIE